MSRIVILFVFLTACNSLSSSNKNAGPKEMFQKAAKLKERGYYKEALKQFRKFKNRFLYSRALSKEADLAIADIYFAQKQWEKAGRAFESFFELNPRHKKSDHALFHLALSYFHRLPATADRDLNLAKKSLFHLNRHLKLFPKSPFKKSAREHKQKVLSLLAQKEWMIALFHIHQGKARSALPYAKTLLKNYSFLLPKDKNKTGQPLSRDLPSRQSLKKLIKDLKNKPK